MCVNVIAAVNIYNSFKYVFKYTFIVIILCFLFESIIKFSVLFIQLYQLYFYNLLPEAMNIGKFITNIVVNLKKNLIPELNVNNNLNKNTLKSLH